METVSEAVAFAVRAHDGMRRKKGNSPYILHPLEAAVIVGAMTDDQQIIAAAVLHDVVEDAGVTLLQVREKFGDRVAALVASETEDKRPQLPPNATWRLRKEESLRTLATTDDPAVRMVWLGDKLANMRAIHRQWSLEGHSMWRNFNQTDPAQQAWYYRSVAELTRSLADTYPWKEYSLLCQQVFGKEV